MTYWAIVRFAGRRLEPLSRSSSWSSSSVKTSLAADFGFVRLTIVNQKTRQPTMHNTAIKFVSRAAVRSFASSALPPDFNTL